jgi:hypothetical protein
VPWACMAGEKMGSLSLLLLFKTSEAKSLEIYLCPFIPRL